MFVTFRRVHKCHFVQLLTSCMALCVMMACWEELDHHVVSHVRSYTYRYLVNRYDFLNSSLAIASSRGPGSPATYPYLINHPGKCGEDDILLLLFVKSSPENHERRRDIRDTWGNESFIRSELGANVKLLFALGVHPHAGDRFSTQRALLEENHIHGDLIQQNFLDTFYNLTAKLILQFHWGHEYCPQARFLMSADDDMFVHLPNLVSYLQGLLSQESGTEDLWVGHVHRGSPPVRRKHNKYHVPGDLYPWPAYPDYTAGAGYVVSRDVVAKIYRATLALNSSIYIDDVFMGICAKAAGLYPQGHPYFAGEAKAPYHTCIYDRMITSHGHVGDVRSLWRATMDHRLHGQPRGPLGSAYCTAVRAMLLCLPYYWNTYSCLAAFT